jgi:DNA-binding transcriptional regulator YdaS (Cro superfamily)
MHKEMAVAHYGSQIKLAQVLGISSSAVSFWGSIIPEKQAMKLERITGGDLVYNPALYLPNEMPST